MYASSFGMQLICRAKKIAKRRRATKTRRRATKKIGDEEDEPPKEPNALNKFKNFALNLIKKVALKIHMKFVFLFLLRIISIAFPLHCFVLLVLRKYIFRFPLTILSNALTGTVTLLTFHLQHSWVRSFTRPIYLFYLNYVAVSVNPCDACLGVFSMHLSLHGHMLHTVFHYSSETTVNDLHNYIDHFLNKNAIAESDYTIKHCTKRFPQIANRNDRKLMCFLP
eukprot:970575_1